MAKIEVTRTTPFELLNHSDLADMPDVAGINSDHDARYYTETEIDTMFLDGTIDHLNLSNIGVNTHVQIDTHLGDATIHALPGEMKMYGAVASPAGWLLCNGAAINRITYGALFAIIGTTFGIGDGATTFNVPDMRGIFPRGAGVNGTLSDANGAAFAGILGTYQNDKSQGHKHQLRTYDNGLNSTLLEGTNTGTGPIDFVPLQFTVTDGVNGTPRVGTETNPANLGLTYIIKY